MTPDGLRITLDADDIESFEIVTCAVCRERVGFVTFLGEVGPDVRPVSVMVEFPPMPRGEPIPDAGGVYTLRLHSPRCPGAPRAPRPRDTSDERSAVPC